MGRQITVLCFENHPLPHTENNAIGRLWVTVNMFKYSWRVYNCISNNITLSIKRNRHLFSIVNVWKGHRKQKGYCGHRPFCIFQNEAKRPRRVASANCTVSISVSGEMSLFYLRAGQIVALKRPLHTLIFAVIRTGHGSCRFTSNFVPMAEKTKMATVIRLEIGDKRFFYIYGKGFLLTCPGLTCPACLLNSR